MVKHTSRAIFSAKAWMALRSALVMLKNVDDSLGRPLYGLNSVFWGDVAGTNLNTELTQP